MSDAPMTPDEIVDYARLTAQRQGKVMLGEMITVLDEAVSKRCDSMRMWIKAWSEDNVDLEKWGRDTHVMESVYSFLVRIDSDPEARDYLARRFRREVIRSGVPVDGGGGRDDADAARQGTEIG